MLQTNLHKSGEIEGLINFPLLEFIEIWIVRLMSENSDFGIIFSLDIEDELTFWYSNTFIK